MSRDKGARGEREVRDLLREHGFEAERGRQNRGGPDSPDVRHSMRGYHIEVKRVESLRLYEALAQADIDRADGEVPVVFHKRNGMAWVAILAAEDFVSLVRERDALRVAYDEVSETLAKRLKASRDAAEASFQKGWDARADAEED